MSNCKNRGDIEMELCLPCREELKAGGRAVTMIQSGSDRKARCALCGRMRYASRYAVSKEVYQE